jgi:hypothetical protein
MNTPRWKYLLAILLSLPLLTGCPFDDDDDDDPVPVPVSDDGNGGSGGDDGSGSDGDGVDSSSVVAIFDQAADAEPIEIDDPEALLANIESTFGVSGDDPQEPEAVLGADQ